MSSGLPESFYCRFLLVDGEPRRRPFSKSNNTALYDYALYAAALCDLYFGGQLIDRAGAPHRTGNAAPDDPVLRRVLDRVPPDNSTAWAQVIHDGERADVHAMAREELRTTGWLGTPRRRLAGLLPAAQAEPAPAVRAELVREVRYGLDRLDAGLPVAPRIAALGLLAHFARLLPAATATGAPRPCSEGVKSNAVRIAPLGGLATALLERLETAGDDIWGAGGDGYYGGAYISNFGDYVSNCGGGGS